MVEVQNTFNEAVRAESGQVAPERSAADAGTGCVSQVECGSPHQEEPGRSLLSRPSRPLPRRSLFRR